MQEAILKLEKKIDMIFKAVMDLKMDVAVIQVWVKMQEKLMLMKICPELTEEEREMLKK